ncbi:MAG: amino acid ABC transporter substrate-binding protein [Deltaproteobacteria bacterium]|nr:amino acid ABC transporter substrate-binding protein [Deltaproteobacteria bacterium]
MEDGRKSLLPPSRGEIVLLSDRKKIVGCGKDKSLLIVIMAFVLWLPVSGDSAEKIFRLSHDDYKPFHWYDKDTQETKGVFIDMVEEILGNRLGYKIVYTEYPWKRAQLQVHNGKEDAYITTPTPERLKYTEIGENSFIVMRKSVFTYANNPKIELLKNINSFDDLRQFKVLDYLGNGWSEKRLVEETGMSPDYSPSIDSVLKKLAAKRGDIFIEDSTIVNYNIRLLGLSKEIVELPVVLEATEFKLCVSKKSFFKNDIGKIDKIISEMTKDGSLTKIMNKWK